MPPSCRPLGEHELGAPAFERGVLTNPYSSQRNAKATAEYKQDYIYARSSVDLFRGPTLQSDCVVGSDGFLVGGEVAYDVQEAKVTKYSAALGYTAKDYAVSLAANNALSVFSASYFHRVSGDVEAGAKAVWDKKSEGPVALEVGTRYVLDRDAAVRVSWSELPPLAMDLLTTRMSEYRDFSGQDQQLWYPWPQLLAGPPPRPQGHHGRQLRHDPPR